MGPQKGWVPLNKKSPLLEQEPCAVAAGAVMGNHGPAAAGDTAMALRVVSEQSEANIRKQRIHDQLTRDLRKFAANFHRMTSGSGKPLDLLQQMAKVAVVPTMCFQCYFQQWVQCVAHRASPQVRFTKDRLMCLNPGWYVVHIYHSRDAKYSLDCDRRPVRPGANPKVREDLGDCPETTRSMQGAF